MWTYYNYFFGSGVDLQNNWLKYAHTYNKCIMCIYLIFLKLANAMQNKRNKIHTTVYNCF